MLSNGTDIQRLLKRRAFILGGLQATLLGVLGWRLGWLQLKENKRYQTLSDQNRIDVRLVAPKRGLIFDRKGVPLALNEQEFRLNIIPEQTDNIRATLEKLSVVIDLRPSEIEKVVMIAKKQASFIPVEVKGNLDWAQVSAIEVNLIDLPGVFVDVGDQRQYPMAMDTAHIVGYVGAVSRSDLNGDPVLSLPGFKIGKSGIEKSLESLMRGKPGNRKVEVNVSGRVVRDLDVDEGEKGRDIALTIDSDLQTFVRETLAKEKSATAVVMNPNTGEVYSLVSSPGFDPNLFTSGISFNQWEELLANEGKPLNNKAVTGQYSPASTFKMITVLAGLEAGVIDRKKTVYCNGFYEVGDHRFHCWKRAGHGWTDVVQAIAQSCDVYFYDMAREVGIERIADMARRFGLGQKYNFELKEERAGLVPDKKWKRGHIGEKWRPGESVVASIGQGYILSTPLQLAVMTSRLVNGGYAVKPWIAGAMGRRKSIMARKSWPLIGIKKRYLDIVKQGMKEAVTGEDGTAKASQIGIPEMEMGGKTGTSQVRRISRQERDEGLAHQNDIRWKWRDHALFVGYAPLEKPNYVVSVIVEHGGSGSAAAAPIANKILKKAQELEIHKRDIEYPANIDQSEAVKNVQNKQEGKK